MALGAILKGPDCKYISQKLIPALAVIRGLFLDKSAKVRETTAWAFSKICENQHSIIIDDQAFFTAFMQNVYELLSDKPRVAKQACACLIELTQSLDVQEGQHSSPLSVCFDSFFK